MYKIYFKDGSTKEISTDALIEWNKLNTIHEERVLTEIVNGNNDIIKITRKETMTISWKRGGW